MQSNSVYRLFESRFLPEPDMNVFQVGDVAVARQLWAKVNDVDFGMWRAKSAVALVVRRKIWPGDALVTSVAVIGRMAVPNE